VVLLRSSEVGTAFAVEKSAFGKILSAFYCKGNEDLVLQMLFDKQRSKVSVPNGYKKRNPHRCKFLPQFIMNKIFFVSVCRMKD